MADIKTIKIEVDAELSAEFHEQLKGFVEDFFKQDATKIKIGEPEG